MLSIAIALAQRWGREREVARVEDLAGQIRDCVAQQEEQLRRLRRLLHQLRVTLRRTIYRQEGQTNGQAQAQGNFMRRRRANFMRRAKLTPRQRASS